MKSLGDNIEDSSVFSVLTNEPRSLSVTPVTLRTAGSDGKGDT